MSLHDRCPYMTGVPTWTGVSTWQVSLHDRCLYMTGVPTWQVPFHHRFLNMGKIRHLLVQLRRLITRWALSSECPFSTGFTLSIKLVFVQRTPTKCPYIEIVPSSEEYCNVNWQIGSQKLSKFYLFYGVLTLGICQSGGIWAKVFPNEGPPGAQ